MGKQAARQGKRYMLEVTLRITELDLGFRTANHPPVSFPLYNIDFSDRKERNHVCTFFG